MRKLKVNTVKEASSLLKVNSNTILNSKFPKDEILRVIERAKTLELEKGKRINALKFMVENYKKDDYPTNPTPLDFYITDTGEKAYQRAIFLSEKTKLNTIGEVIWNDIELPVVLNSNRRRPSIDLIGTLNNNILAFCELKFNSAQSPIYAAIELLIYYYLIEDNCEKLDEYNVFHKNDPVKPFKWSDCNRNTILIVGANKDYWNYWKERYKNKKRENDFEDWRNSLPLRIRFFSSENFNFKKQKEQNESNDTYKPSVFDKTEWTEEFTK